MNLMNKMMFNVHRSELGFDETVASLKASAEKHGWEISMVHDLQKVYQDAGHEDMTRVKILYFCNPDGGYRILQDDENKPMSVMMPMGISVYETHDGQVHIAGMNLGNMSKMMGGVVKEVLQEGATNYAAAVEDIATPEEAEEDIEVDKGKCCLGCAILTAIAGALLGLMIFLMTKLMPLLMAKMMPKMMETMEKAGVRPPCAEIILEHMEAQETE